jgi:hypothetical protein
MGVRFAVCRNMKMKYGSETLLWQADGWKNNFDWCIEPDISGRLKLARTELTFVSSWTLTNISNWTVWLTTDSKKDMFCNRFYVPLPKFRRSSLCKLNESTWQDSGKTMVRQTSLTVAFAHISLLVLNHIFGTWCDVSVFHSPVLPCLAHATRVNYQWLVGVWHVTRVIYAERIFQQIRQMWAYRRLLYAVNCKYSLLGRQAARGNAIGPLNSCQNMSVIIWTSRYAAARPQCELFTH